MARTIDITGQTFGRLTVLRFSHTTKGAGSRPRRYYVVRCECGTEKSVLGGSLREGKALSCGCLNREVVVAMRTTHGHTRGPGRPESGEYGSWRAMRERCYNPKGIGYANYGGRGITVCAEWRDDFPAFLRVMGPKPTPEHSIDRIDNDGNYEPSNCRWATRTEQNNNTRRTRSAS